MPVVYDEFQVGEPRDISQIPSTRREVLTETFAATFEENPIMAVHRWNELRIDEKTGPKLDVATARQRLTDAGYENDIQVNEGGITEAALSTLMERKRVERRRQDVFSRAQGGLAETSARFGLSMATTLADPVSAGLNFVPVVGQARYARWTANASMAQRAGIRAGVGAAEGTAGSALAEIPVVVMRNSEQADYTAADSLLNIALGGVTGLGLHTVVGSAGDLYRAITRGERLVNGQLPGVDNRYVINPIDRAAAPEAKLAQLKSLTEENRPLVDAIVADLNQALEGTSSKLNVKEDANILAKAARPSILAKKPWHGIEHVRDALRFKTVLDSFDQLPQVVDRLKAHGVSIVKVDTDKLLQPDLWGWRIVSLDLRMKNGQLVEHYMPIKELEAAKKAQGHALFEKWRNRDIAKMTPEEVAQMHADRNKSIALYQGAYEAALARTGQPESAVRASLKTFSARSRSLMSTQSSSGYTAASLRQTPSTLRATNPGVTTARSSPSRDSQTIGAEVSTGGILPPGGTRAGLGDITAAERVAGASPEVREAALRAAVGQAVTGSPINVDGILNARMTRDPSGAATPQPQKVADTTEYTSAQARAEEIEKEPFDNSLEAAQQEADLAIADAQLLADRLGIERADPELEAVEEGVAMAERWAKAAEVASTCLLRGG